ncbi:RagB/SusD family nutrient uptake outer membrane protein [Algoriphagus zhangzhouensis]|uniref:Starch-binding associating with outer membrane n=1 Tax=Algoriphagus zhangzhouensis TaxID=1073327 RepID=A0A1M7ZKE7_9BACT|nr:RagB/SusD family nutrient uptake outer membrane protein [Algoriphagus zhangzhouensis]TDY43196.1 putative outer membrane starch-binding protein [Algoriphagus zhangzhouensis]SHO65347.1 Starch-binding associating with outer membrane [Algoriphagus zhangzhouensis]
MKTRIINKKLLILLMVMVSFSCQEDFLEEKPLSFLSPDNTYNDAAGLQTALDAALRGVLTQWNGDTRELMFNSNMSDASVVSATDKPDAFVDLRVYATPTNSRNNDAGRARSFYADNYNHIKKANTVIDFIDNPDWDGGTANPERNHLLGSAYFLRAFFYMQLTMDFGNVAFPLTVAAEAKRDFKAFYMQGIWDQMIVDLEYAVEHMKPKSALALGQPPKDAARILLAKYYMLNERFAEAEQLMDDVINGGESILFTDGMIPSGVTEVEVANTNNPNTGNPLPGRSGFAPVDAVNYLHMEKDNQKLSNPEGIWYIVNTPFVLGTQGRSARIRAWGPNFVSTNLGVWEPGTTRTGTDVQQSTSDSRGRMMKKWGRGQGFARPTNYSQYEIWNYDGVVDEQDYRHKDLNWFEMEDVLYDNPSLEEDGSPYYMQPLRLYDDDGNLTCLDTIRCWFGYPRYKFFSTNFQDRPDRQDGGKMSMYVMRIAEAYLVRAEARFWQGDYAGTADDINTIRTRANAMTMYTVADVMTDGIGAVLDERNRELFGEEYRHDELVRVSVILAKTGQAAYNGKTYSISGTDIEVSLSANSFYYDRMMEKNNFFRDEVPWATYNTTKYTMDPMHIYWPVYQPYLVGNVGAVLNQTTGYNGAESNIEPLTHIIQPAGVPNIDPMEALNQD